jgi:hypothetical protein
VNVGAWCGHCGESFRLAELVDGGFDGRCPRCGKELAEASYLPVASGAVHDVLRAAAALDEAATRLREVAPRLHVDGRKLRADLTEALGE